MSDLNKYYAYKASTSGADGGGGDGCLVIFFAILVCAVPMIGIPLVLIVLFIDSIRRNY